MKPSDMLHQMCHALLAKTDVKALCQTRDLSPQAVSAPGILETLFLSQPGLSDVFNTLESNEIALLHLLKSAKEPVDIAFFSRAYGGGGHRYGTFNQRYEKTFAKVKTRLIRGGVLLWAEAGQNLSLIHI